MRESGQDSWLWFIMNYSWSFSWTPFFIVQRFMLNFYLTESSFKLLHRCVTIATRVILYSLLWFTYLNCFLKLILHVYTQNLYFSYFPRILVQGGFHKKYFEVLYLKFIPKIILEIVLELLRGATGLFQQGLSLGSFKNSFVGDFGTPSLNPSPELLQTRPGITSWKNYQVQFPLQF